MAILKRDDRRLLRIAATGCVFLALLVVLQAVSGWPAFRARVPVTQPTVASAQLAAIHHVAGHWSLPLFALLLPSLLAAAMRRRTPHRRAVHILAIAMLSVLWFAAAFTGYLLPQPLPEGPREVVAATILRFAVLHMFAIPAMLTVLSVILAWRHWRRSLAVPVERRASARRAIDSSAG